MARSARSVHEAERLDRTGVAPDAMMGGAQAGRPGPPRAPGADRVQHAAADHHRGDDRSETQTNPQRQGGKRHVCPMDDQFVVTCPYCGEEVEIYLEPDTRTRHGLQQTSQSWTKLPWRSGSR